MVNHRNQKGSCPLYTLLHLNTRGRKPLTH